jgi:hypothetical protein
MCKKHPAVGAKRYLVLRPDHRQWPRREWLCDSCRDVHLKVVGSELKEIT